MLARSRARAPCVRLKMRPMRISSQVRRAPVITMQRPIRYYSSEPTLKFTELLHKYAFANSPVDNSKLQAQAQAQAQAPSQLQTQPQTPIQTPIQTQSQSQNQEQAQTHKQTQKQAQTPNPTYKRLHVPSSKPHKQATVTQQTTQKSSSQATFTPPASATPGDKSDKALLANLAKECKQLRSATPLANEIFSRDEAKVPIPNEFFVLVFDFWTKFATAKDYGYVKDVYDIAIRNRALEAEKPSILNAILQIYARLNLPDEIEACYNELTPKEQLLIDASTFETLMEYYCNRNQPADTLRFWRDVEALKVDPSGTMYGLAFHAMAALDKLADLRSLLSTLRRTRKSQIALVEGYDEALNLAVKLDDVSSLKELVEEMQANNIAWKSVATKRKVESFIREHDIDLNLEHRTVQEELINENQEHKIQQPQSPAQPQQRQQPELQPQPQQKQEWQAPPPLGQAIFVRRLNVDIHGGFPVFEIISAPGSIPESSTPASASLSADVPSETAPSKSKRTKQAASKESPSQTQTAEATASKQASKQTKRSASQQTKQSASQQPSNSKQSGSKQQTTAPKQSKESSKSSSTKSKSR